MAVSKRTRYEVLRRDNHTCRYCHATDQPLTVDHVTPTALGGTDSPDNLVAACRDCNAGKSSTQPDQRLVADVSVDMVRWAKAMRQAVQIRSSMQQAREEYAYDADCSWIAWEINGREIPRPPDWEATLWRFYDVGLPISEVQASIEIACSNRRIGADNMWRYMCGVAWKKVTELQALAREQLDWVEGD